MITRIAALFFIVASTLASGRTCLALTAQFNRGLIPTPLGKIHFTSVSWPDRNPKELPIVAFHQTPRSSDEYRDIMEICQGRTFIAMDQLGYGKSDNPIRTCRLDEIADSVLTVLDQLGVQKCIVTGSFDGCCLALSLASRHPQRVAAVVCSNLYHFPLEARREALQKENDYRNQAKIPDNWKLSQDGAHINNVWKKRCEQLSPDLNTRVTFDELQFLMIRKERYAKGIHVQEAATFPLDNACWNTFCPVLCINGAKAVTELDGMGMDMSNQFREAMSFFINPPTQITLAGGSIYMLNENAADWWEIVSAFIHNIEGGPAVQSPFYDQRPH